MSVRIASLVLEGFKSFATRVELTFPGNMVAIVGPNGAGKSNVCDAIAWVLGEQSARSLRSQNMADVIFAGSAQRPPAGAAQVTLVLQPRNGQGDHSWEISRRLLRDGTSEYRLQGKRVRLKDIAHKLAEAGLGTRAYAIIEQGKISQVLSARPTDRRALFEEAAGISHFRLQRQEAELKLAETRGNLERLLDILGEVKRELTSLRRQAKQAQQHAQLAQEAKKLASLIAWLRLQELEGELHKAQEALAQAQDQRAKTATALAREEAKLLQSQRRWEKAAEAFRQQELSQAQLLATCQRLEAEEAGLRRELASLREREEQARENWQRAQKQLEEEKSQEEEVQGRLELVRQQRQALEEAAQQAREKAQGEEKRAQEAESHAEEARAQLLRQVAAAAEARNRYHRLQVEQEQLAYQQNRLATEKERLTEHLARQAQEEEEASAAEARLQEEVLKLQEEASRQQEAMALLENRLALLAKERDELEHRLWEVRHEHQAVERARLQLRALPESLTRLLPDHLLAGTVADYLNPSPEHSQLFDQAYGDFLSLPVVQGEEAVALLWQHPPGDGVLEVAIRDTRLPPQDHPNLSQAGVKEEEAGWLSRLLPHLVEAQTPQQAQVLAASPQNLVLLPGGGQRQGQRLRFLGKSQRLAGALQLRQKEQELKAVQEELSTRLQGVEAAIAQLAQEKAQNETRLASCLKQLQHTKERLAETSSRRQAHHRERLRLQKEMEALQLEAAHLQKEQARVDQELAAAEAQARLGEERAAQASAAVDEKAALASETREKALAARAEAEKVRTQLLLTQEREAQGERELVRHRERQKQLAQQSRQLQGEIARLQQAQQEVAESLASTRARLQKALEELAQGQEKIAQAQAEAEKCKKQLEQQQLVVGQLRQEDQKAQEALHACQLQVAQLTSQRALLAEDVSEDLPETKPTLEELPQLLQKQQEVQQKLASLGPVNELAISQEQELAQRFHFLQEQKKDLERSLASLQESLRQLDATCKERFLNTLEEANGWFGEIFRQLFGGGEAQVALSDPESPLDSGVEVRVRPPGKHTQSVLLLSGGEKALAALALLLALFRIRPAPFCVLDEVDAPLDDLNVERLCQHLRAQAETTQFLLITHNRRTMAYADVLYGVTMEEPGVSRIVSVRLEDL